MDSIPIDPHHEKWSKLLVPNKGVGEAVEQIEKKMKDYLKFTGQHLSGLNMSLPNKTFKDLSKQNDYLSNYHEKITKQYEELLRRKHFQPFPKYGSENVATSYVISPEQISPLLKVGEERIKALEEEMYLRERELSKLAGMIDLLIDENKYLREHIAFKNKDIAKVLETIGLNDGESIHDLRHRINLLTEENNLLLSHLEEMRVVKDNFDRFTREKNTDLERARELYENVKNSLEDALSREETLTHQKQVVETRYHDMENRMLELERDIDDLSTELNQTRNNFAIAQNQAQNYKKAYEDAETKKSIEQDTQLQEVNSLKNDKRELQHLLDQRERQLDAAKDEVRKAQRAADQKQNELDDFMDSVRELKDQYEKERSKVLGLQQKEREWKEKYDQAINEVNLTNMKAQQSENQLRKLQDSQRNELQQRQTKYDKALESMKTNKEEIVAEKDAEIQSLNKQVVEMKKVMDRLREEKNHLTDQVKEYSLGENPGRANNEEINRLRQENERLKEDLRRTEVFKHSEEDQRFAELFKQAEQLRREKEELAAENQKLRTASQKINDMNKSLVEELKVRENEFRERPQSIEEEHKGPVGYDPRGGRTDFSLGADTNTRAPANETKRVVQSVSTADNQGPSSIENQFVQELQSENQYLRELLKNAISQKETKNPVGSNIQTLGTPYQQAVNFSISSPLQPDQTESSKKIYNLQPGSAELARQLPQTDPYIAREQNIDKVVKNILEKYNLTSVPDKGELHKVFGSQETLRDRSSFVSPIQHPTRRGYEDDQYIRGSAMNFLSPLVSSAEKFDGKIRSYESSAGKY